MRDYGITCPAPLANTTVAGMRLTREAQSWPAAVLFALLRSFGLKCLIAAL